MDGWAYTGAPDECSYCYVHGPGIVKLDEKGDCPVCMPRILNEAVASGVFYREVMPHAVSVGRSNASWHPEVLASFEKGFTSE